MHVWIIAEAGRFAHHAEAEEFKDKLKEVEDVCNPIISAAYGKGGEEGGSSDEDLGDHDEL